MFLTSITNKGIYIDSDDRRASQQNALIRHQTLTKSGVKKENFLNPKFFPHLFPRPKKKKKEKKRR